MRIKLKDIIALGANVKEALTATPGIVEVRVEFKGFHFRGQYSDTGDGAYAFSFSDSSFLKVLELIRDHVEDPKEEQSE